MSVLEMSVSSALNKLPKKMFLVLWGIALLRLLVPVSIPSRFSVYSVMNGMAKPIVPSTLIALAPNAMPIGSEGTAPAKQFIGIMPEAGSVITPITMVWLAGMMILFSFFVIVYIKNDRALRSALPIHDALLDEWLAQNKLIRPLAIMQSDKITTPIAVGVIKPRIIMPKTMNWEDKQQVQYVLLHEYYHIRRFDMLWKLIFVFALCVHWFNPLVWLMLVLVNRDLEVTCDEMVVSHFGINTKTNYAYSLSRMAEQRSQFTPLYNGFSKNAAEERITAIMKYKKSSLTSIVLAALLIFALATAFAASPATPQPQDIALPPSSMQT
ncbi:MAG: M56 family metallopeptidase [Clostridiales bacterium]|nr:M56 family metallopeptidase [Clostridiales bacterium]